ncbi:MAG: class I tRNA ligase family protein [Patescibacteria group bacterium]|nr:class I tRNA ligase family protein [Patescibacteria group bacterium]
MLKDLEKFSLPEIEEKVLDFWRKNNIPEKNLDFRKNQKKTFVFYEGPPSANARPGIHHVLARVFKDIILRFKTMNGFFVPRKGGWDTHGLPIELEVEKKLGLKSKKEIEEFGIKEFNKKCRELVWQYKEEWEKLTERIGFWLDLKNPYITYENSYIETLWWILKNIWDKNLLYKGHKVVPFCTRCGTALSSHEAALGYKEVEELSVYVKFKLRKDQQILQYKTDDRTYILSWTTTPWTLPGNIALAVGRDIEYRAVKDSKNKEIYILASELISKVFKTEELENILDIKGKNLIDLGYEPLFKARTPENKTAHKVYPAKFVSTEEGTGVVHIAVMYGEDDYNLGKEVGLPEHHTVDEQGKFTKDVVGFHGMKVKTKETDEKIFDHLKKQGNFLRSESYKHEYPFCWRCDTPLLYYARDSWFIAMSKLREKLLAANKKINWVPEHLQDGRFGEWLKEVKDWAVSRERYWGTPMPIWQCKKCGHQKVIGSFKELSNLKQKASNRYLVMRHGEAETNIKNIINSDPKDKNLYPLTLKGRTAVQRTVENLKKEKIDLIVASDFRRTKETAEIVASGLGVKEIIFEKRLREINTGEFNGKPGQTYGNFTTSYIEKFTKVPPGGENLLELAKRVSEALFDLEKKHKGKTILIISHEYPIWMLETSARGWGVEQSIEGKEARGDDFIGKAEWREIDLFYLPRNEYGITDPHRPYVDEFEFKCKESGCGGAMKRIPEVIDVWFDSGAMPFAQNHWLFKGNENIKKPNNFPAEYISEAMDQTRGWFYTLLAVSVLLGFELSFKNVISLGLVLNKDGQKMSKSRGNVIDPWAVIAKYGVDAIRWYFFTINPPGETKKFDELDLVKGLRRFILLIYNSFVFFDSYACADFNSLKDVKKTKLVNVLDRWIIARLNETIIEATEGVENYDVGRSAKSIENFVEDLSKWYIRRSRRRFSLAVRGQGNEKEKKDYKNASETLGHALIVLSKLMAPFTPFFAEALYKSLNKNHEASVHFEEWPEADKEFIDKDLIDSMEKIRKLASAVLAKRAEVKIKVRQPLLELKINLSADGHKSNNQKELLDILKDEINVKNIVFDKSIKNEFELDTKITHELKEEGWLREFVRIVQDLRQDGKFEPKDKIALMADGGKELTYVFEKNEDLIKKEINAISIDFKRSAKFSVELETRLDEWPLWIGIRKIEN